MAFSIGTLRHEKLRDIHTPHWLAELEAAICSETEADSRISTHQGNVSAHHNKTTLFNELTDRWTLAQAHRGADGKIMVFKGPGADPVEEDKPAGGGDAFLVVAAADTPASLKNRAAYTCDGTAATGGDQSEINAALGAADIVMLSPGTYWIDGSISMASGKALISFGAVLKLKNAINATINMIVNSDQSNGNDHILIKNLRLDGNKANNTSGDQGCIYFYQVAPSDSSPGCKIEGCIFENFRGKPIRLQNCYNSSVLGNTFIGSDGYNIHIQSSHYNVISGNVCRGGYHGVFVTGSEMNTVSGNTFSGAASYGIYMDGNHNVASGNTCKANLRGIHLVSHYCVVSNNSCWKNQQEGIYVLGFYNIISGNAVSENSEASSYAYDNICVHGNSDYNLVTGNYCHRGAYQRPRYGINIDSANATNNMVEGNNLYQSGHDGDLNDAGTDTRKRNNLSNTGTWLTDV